MLNTFQGFDYFNQSFSKKIYKDLKQMDLQR